MTTIVFAGEEMEVEVNRDQNGNASLFLTVEGGLPAGKCSAFVAGADLAPDEVIVKDYSEYAGMLDCLVDAEIVSEPIRWVSSGFVTMPVCRLLI